MFSVGFLNKNEDKIIKIAQINPLIKSNNIVKTYGNLKENKRHTRHLEKHIPDDTPVKPKELEKTTKSKTRDEEEKEEKKEKKKKEEKKEKKKKEKKILHHSPKHNENKYFENMYTSMDGYSMGDPIDDKLLFSINKNISDFVNSLLVNKIKNILLVCSDYPGYGGAATNCKKIADFLIKLNFNVYTVYWLWDNEPNKKYSSDNFHTVVDRRYLPNIFNTIINGVNKPDVVILKSALSGYNLKKFFNVPVYFLIPGLFRNQLNKHYLSLSKQERKIFLNRQVITQIKNSSFSFANSQHVKSYLNELEIKVGIFHSTFIDRYKHKIVQDPLFKNRKYKYGLVVSDFNRTIKNVDKSIDYLKDYSNNTILIGKNSNKYSQLGFTCVDLVPHENMVSYYKQIKYIVQDSHFEACSNVLVEASFNGCKLEKKPIKNIIVSSTQYPGYGGSATNAYNIIKYLRKRNYNVIGLFFDNSKPVNYDPDNIGNIFVVSYNTSIIKLKQHTKRIVTSIFNSPPDICISKNYVAPIYCNTIFPNTPNIFLVSGLPFFKNNPHVSAIEFLNSNDKYKNYYYITNLIKSIKWSHTTVCNSLLTKNILHKMFPTLREKINDKVIDTSYMVSEFINYDIPEEKKYDIIFCCSRLDRKQKNPQLVYNILKNKKFDKFTKLIIGMGSKKYYPFYSIPNTTCLDILPQKEVIRYMLHSKFILCPSTYDSNPNTCKEAISTGCIPIISKNIGTHEKYPDYLVCKNLTKNEWVTTLFELLNKYDIIKECYKNIHFEKMDIQNLF